ncbi:hypothetical protein ACF0H5_006926 [Mactra antiquata]
MALKETYLRSELDIATKISTLEERAAKLETEFDSIGAAAKDLANIVKCYVDKVETERKSWDVIDSILESGPNAYDVFNHMKVFFNFLLSKMEIFGVNITDITMLWHLYDDEGVHETFIKAMKYFGFNDSDESDLRVLLAVVYKQHIDMEKEQPLENDDEDSAEDNATHDVSAIDNADLENILVITAHDCDALLERDFTKLSLDPQTTKLAKTIHVESSLRKVITRVMGIVVYLLNVGRVDKTLSIIPDKERLCQENDTEKSELVLDS